MYLLYGVDRVLYHLLSDGNSYPSCEKESRLQSIMRRDGRPCSFLCTVLASLQELVQTGFVIAIPTSYEAVISVRLDGLKCCEKDSESDRVFHETQAPSSEYAS